MRRACTRVARACGGDQEAVFQALGGEVVQQAMAGFNTSVFAYGQTGAGKSYSMMGGKGDDRGLIPRICEGMFSAGTAASPGAGPVCKVEVSYLEIYMEQVKDLLNPSNTRKLRVREHATTGPYVEDLTQVLLLPHAASPPALRTRAAHTRECRLCARRLVRRFPCGVSKRSRR